MSPATKSDNAAFISYSSHDKEFAARLAKDLDRAGVRVWFDERDLAIGDNIVSAINTALANSKYLIVVLSRASVNSGWVTAEVNAKLYEQFTNRQVTVLPVLKEECAIPPLLKAHHYADFRTNYDRALRRLIQQITGQSIATRERRTWVRRFIGFSIDRSYGFASVIAAGNGLAFYLLALRLKRIASPTPTAISIDSFQHFAQLASITHFTFAILLLGLCLFFHVGIRRVHRVLLQSSSVTIGKPIDQGTSRGGDPYVFISEAATVESSMSPDGELGAEQANIFFSISNLLEDSKLKIWDIRTRVYGIQQQMHCCDGPRHIVIIDEDASFIATDRTIEIPPGESASFKLSYRISTSLIDDVAFGIVIHMHDRIGRKYELRSDVAYLCRSGRVEMIDASYAASPKDHLALKAKREHFGLRVKS